jgi:thioredoxin 1
LAQDVVEKFRVKALPTFLLIKEGEEQRRVVGAKVEELNMALSDIG